MDPAPPLLFWGQPVRSAGGGWGGAEMITLLVSPALPPPPDTRYSVEDIEEALLKQLKAAKETAIVVKKPEEDNIRFSNYGNPPRTPPVHRSPANSVFSGEYLAYCFMHFHVLYLKSRTQQNLLQVCGMYA